MKRTKALLMAALLFPPVPNTRVIDHDTDDPSRLTPNGQVEMNLRSLDTRSRRSVPNVISPWSDITWKANKGLIVERFGDSRYETAKGWTAKHNFLQTYNPGWILGRNLNDRNLWIAALSPAEKYDMLMGTIMGGLAENIEKFLDTTLGSQSEFPGWWGLCEGSAVSTVYYSEPIRPVFVHSEAYNLDIPFYATDIKGLATMLWSRFNTELNLPESGLQCQPDGKGCLGSNPASFHASVHHFLDLSPGILVGDMDRTPVVWNFPLVAYSETYFRPDNDSKKEAPNLKAAALRVSDWPADPRKNHRSPGTAYLVGIRMKISYAVNQTVNPPNEGSLKRKINSRVLVYELELDSDWNLLGGEWLAGKQPQLLWAVPHGVVPDTIGDKTLPIFDTERAFVPKIWEEAARKSAEHLTPLRRVVEMLIQRSSNQQ